MQYLIGDVLYDSDAPGFQEALQDVHALRLRPLCTCQEVGAPMYVARVLGQYVIKRMPFTARQHAVWCSSYEASDELSGLGQLRGDAIREDADEGVTTLQLGFPFVRGSLREAPSPSETPGETVKADKAKLSLLSMLHYLWHGAELTKWSPGMMGKRSWSVVQRQILLASAGARAKGEAISERLYVPEPFAPERKAEIAARRLGRLAKLMTAGAAKARPLMMLVGEVKSFGPARYDYRMMVKHCPDFAFFLTEDLHRRMTVRFARELSTWNGQPDIHLIAIALFSLPPSGTAQIEEIALMAVDAQWLPMEGGLDVALIDRLVRERRVFERQLRFNMAASKPMAIALLYDTSPKLTALFVQPAGASSEWQGLLEEMASRREETLASWVWKAEEGEMPVLPDRRPVEAARRELFRPMFLLRPLHGEGAPKLVCLSSPIREHSEEGSRLVAAILGTPIELADLSSSAFPAIGLPAHVQPEDAAWEYRRLSAQELQRLKTWQTERQAIRRASEAPMQGAPKATGSVLA